MIELGILFLLSMTIYYYLYLQTSEIPTYYNMYLITTTNYSLLKIFLKYSQHYKTLPSYVNIFENIIYKTFWLLYFHE